ncbi:hypothetical protein [Roseixanthobacter glucoisosaccharinicivorans]|uniref:hypothetical protein n=1 Tax=Roseixanthobacter glucoisosaccharinicivorans TaxID=3119923 RepID=UPI0037281407
MKVTIPTGLLALLILGALPQMARADIMGTRQEAVQWHERGAGCDPGIAGLSDIVMPGDLISGPVDSPAADRARSAATCTALSADAFP